MMFTEGIEGYKGYLETPSFLMNDYPLPYGFTCTYKNDDDVPK